MDNVLLREASDKDIPILLGLLYDLGRQKNQKDSDLKENAPILLMIYIASCYLIFSIIADCNCIHEGKKFKFFGGDTSSLA